MTIRDLIEHEFKKSLSKAFFDAYEVLIFRAKLNGASESEAHEIAITKIEETELTFFDD